MTDHPADLNVTRLKDNITLVCTAVGFPAPEVTWFHNGTLESNDSYITDVINAYTTSSSYVQLIADTDDSGSYYCQVTVDGYSAITSDTVTVLVQG